MKYKLRNILIIQEFIHYIVVFYQMVFGKKISRNNVFYEFKDRYGQYCSDDIDILVPLIVLIILKR